MDIDQVLIGGADESEEVCRTRSGFACMFNAGRMSSQTDANFQIRYHQRETKRLEQMRHAVKGKG